MNEWEVTKNEEGEIEWWNQKKLIMIRLVYLKDLREWVIDSNVIILPKSKVLIPPLFFTERKKALKTIIESMKEFKF